MTTKNVPYYTFNFTTSKVSTSAVFARAFNADGVDYVLSVEPSDDESYIIPPNVDIPLETATSVCYLYQPVPSLYVNFTYDPSLETLFVGGFDTITPDSTPAEIEQNKKARLNPAAYAVPIVAVVLLVIGAIAVIMLVPSIRRKVLPGSVRDNTLRVTEFEQPSPNRPVTIQEQPKTQSATQWSESKTPKPKDWRKSAKPVDGALE